MVLPDSIILFHPPFIKKDANRFKAQQNLGDKVIE
jgi:hypothetical protein